MFLNYIKTIFKSSVLEISIIRANLYLSEFLDVITQKQLKFSWVLAWKAILYSYCVLTALRFIATSYVIYYHLELTESILGYDPLICTLVLALQVDHWAALVHAPIPIMALYLDYLFFFKFSRYI